MSGLRRRLDPECLDRDGWAEDDLRESLRLVSEANRGLGGLRWVLRSLDELGEVNSILDVGTGNGELVLRLTEHRWNYPSPTLQAGGFQGVVGLDLRQPIARVAHERTKSAWQARVVRADGLRLPFADLTFDVVVSTLTLHHFTADEAVTALREMSRVARRRILVADLVRSRVSLLGARLLARTLWRRNVLTRVDGPLSVQKAFTRHELSRMAESAGLGQVEVRSRFPGGLTLSARPGPAPILARASSQ